MRMPAAMPRVPEVLSLLEGADHVDVKIVSGAVSMRAFVAAMLGYQPRWISGLYRVRGLFVRLLGLRQTGLPRAPQLSASTLPMAPGERVGFFRLRLAQDESHWVAEADDAHLKAALGVVVEPLPGGHRRFYVLTIVHYHTWAGPVYFNAMRPFHHLVVGRMAMAGLRASG
jgi:hypothetical protein